MCSHDPFEVAISEANAQDVGRQALKVAMLITKMSQTGTRVVLLNFTNGDGATASISLDSTRVRL